MALGVLTGEKPPSALRGSRSWVCLALALTSISCVPVTAADESGLRVAAIAVPAPLLDQGIGPSAAAPVPTFAGAFADEGSTLRGGLTRLADGQAFRGRTPLDQLRSLDCLSQAVYYEAASESEDGQRAVAQVVLNRVRHPAWPNSVCGVVYQGPLRPGGGCQFTFTCDGSLSRRPGGIAWARARTIAAEALAGRAYAGVGLSTHYHTHAVSPAWAPSLQKTAAIGAHQFYRLPGVLSAPAAFAASYSGIEPLPRPSMLLVRRPAPAAGLATFVPTSFAVQEPAFADAPPVARSEPAPPSTVRDEYRHSGQWREDAPAAITGRR